MRLIFILFALSGCMALHDEDGLNPKPIKEDLFHDMYAPEEDEFVAENESMQSDNYQKPEMSEKFNKKVSINIMGDADIREALTSLASELGISVRISENITHKAIFTAHNEPFLSVIKDLSKMLNWRYEIDGEKLFIKCDEPYFKTYDVHFLNISREISSSISTNSNVLSSNASHEQEAQVDLENNGSSSTVSTSSVNNFWSELENNLSAIIGSKGSMTLHKQAGIISVTAPHKIQQEVDGYLNKLKKNCSAQVVVEAKILEVNLYKDFRSGVNWESLRRRFILGMPMADAINKENAFDPLKGSGNLFTLGVNDKKLSVLAVLHMIEKFGSIRTLSNPRITIMNNQTGIIKVAKQEVYFNLRYDNRYQNTLNGNNRESIYSNIKTVPVGLVFSVHPVVNTETGEITLTLRPSISRISAYKEDPSVAFLESSRLAQNGTLSALSTAKIGNLVPVIEIREMDSVLKVKSGDVVILGGLMSETSERGKTGLPHISNTEVFGEAFSSNSEENSVSEIVIFLRVRITNNPATSVSRKDKSLYKKFAVDNRPLSFEKNDKKTNTKTDKK